MDFTDLVKLFAIKKICMTSLQRFRTARIESAVSI